MAMTKAEKAQMKEAIDRADLLAALRWTEKVEKDICPPDSGSKYSEGWDCNDFTGDVFEGWSTSVTHGQGKPPSDGNRHASGSQKSRWLFSTKEKALKAVRHRLEMQFAQRLMVIDRQLKALQE